MCVIRVLYVLVIRTVHRDEGLVPVLGPYDIHEDVLDIFREPVNEEGGVLVEI
jgi:hypothetical protein